MEMESATAFNGVRDEISILVNQLRDTEQRLQELTGGGVDSVIYPTGESHMLQDAQEELRRNETRFRTILQGVEAGVLVYGPDSRVTACNAMAAKLLGVTETELLGRSVFDSNVSYVRRDGSPMSAAELPYSRALAGRRRIHDVILGARHPVQDDLIWLWVSANPIFTERDDIAEIIVTFMDVTARIGAERALEESEGRYRALVDWSPESISVQREGKLLFVNTATIKMMGAKSADDLVGKSILDLVHPDFRQMEAARMKRATDENAVLEVIEEKMIKLDGTTIEVQVRGTPIIYDGELALYSSRRDITEQKRITTRFRRLLDSNIESVFFWNEKGEVTESNDAFLHVMGYTREDLAAGSINWLAMTPPEYADIQERSFVELAATGICSTYEKEMIRKDGSRIPILLGAATFEDNTDEGVCFVLDLTERKRLERQFLQVQKMEGIGTLAGGVAHDFNNILAIIQMQADFLIDEGGLSADQANSANDIVAAVKRGASLTRQLLLFTRRAIFQPSELDLNPSVADTTRMLRRIVGEHVDVQLKLSPQPMFVQGDSGMLDQVLLNLVVNARDAMPSGGQLVIQTSGAAFDELAASQSAHARVGSFVCLSVSDTGSGIAPEILPKIFDPFFTTKAIGKGTGLGLATVFGIVQQHRGWVNVTSEVGFGTTFRVYLPRLEKHMKATRAPSALTVGYGGSEKILLAEDDPLLRDSMQRVLSQLGYRVLVAPTGAEALEVWQNKREEIRLLITDLLMPDGMTGKDLAQRILEDDPEMKVIYMSGYSADIIGKDSPLPECCDFLSKPFSAHRLSQVVRDCLDKK
jgi:two-component system cell cycle sensor histidine kinase/response regulator CckA